MTFTIKEIQEKLQTIEDPQAEWVLSLSEDPRKGVQQALTRFHNKMAEKAKRQARFEELLAFENSFLTTEGQRIIGIDEVGRGPLAGPVVVASVILDLDTLEDIGLADSKDLTHAKRVELATWIKENALAYKVVKISNEVIDQTNILAATTLAMEKAITCVGTPQDFVLVDAVKVNVPNPHEVLIKGDQRSLSIQAASILAKVYRDHLMQEYDYKYPGYGFAQHMGYGTAAHLDALRTKGVTPIHRKSFAPVKNLL